MEVWRCATLTWGNPTLTLAPNGVAAN
ncbi:MAG: hypothetical protein ACJAW1_000409, partial [Glaciecola sp.]